MFAENWRVRRRLLPATLVLAAALAPLATAATPAGAREDEPALPAMQVVVLVDESGSLSDDDVLREREAARTIAFSVLAPDSVFSVVGFGSSDGPGQSPVDVVCRPTVLGAGQSRDALATCVDKIQRRRPDQGADTDHAAALQQALSFVRAGKPAKKVVFLLTDGVLDVRNSPAYGPTPQRRDAAARAKVGRVLDELDGVDAQVWPLGFGSVDRSALSGFARGDGCAEKAADPAARVVANSDQLSKAVAEAFSSAGCVVYLPSAVGTLDPGGTTDLHVDIPTIASDASIVVHKRDPRVQVAYLAPGSPTPVTEGGPSKIEFAGQSTDMESIRLTDPEPGRWTVRLSSASVGAKDVRATVVYQAAVRAYLSANPPRPAAGQDVDVEMQVWARNKAITDPAALRDLSFVTTLTGEGIGSQRVALGDADGDGTFTGRVAVPAGATGALTFTGRVTGVGIGGDTRVLDTRVQGPGDAVQGQILFDDNRATVIPGGTLTGKVKVDNRSGREVRLRFVVADPSPGAALSVDPPVVTAAAGRSEVPFTLRVGADSPIGTSSATLRLVGDADQQAVAAERLFATDVAPEPSLPYRLRWWLLVAAVLLAIGLVWLALRLRARNEARKVGGLVARLYSSGIQADELDATDPQRKVFRFVVHQDFTGLQLQPAAAGEPEAYEVRRTATGLELTPPHGARAPLAVGQLRRIGEDLSIAVVDTRGGGAGHAEPDVDPGATTAFNPFGAVTPIPAPRAEPATTPLATGTTDPYPPPQDPFASGGSYDPNNPFN